MGNRIDASVSFSYLGVVMIWSTTPLAIKWSTVDAGFLFGVFVRMLIGTALSIALVLLTRRLLPFDRQSIKAYLAAGISIYAAMMCVYWGSQYIPSGLISVLFGLAPMLTSLLAARWLSERGLGWFKILGLLLGMLGLWVIFQHDIGQGQIASQGIWAVLLAVILHSASAVLVKVINAPLPALSITAGGLLVSLPFFTVSWLLGDGHWPEQISDRGLTAIIYLGVAGSVIGFSMYYHLLERLKASTVALVTLMTPVSALLLGRYFNQEVIGTQVWYGTMLVLLGLSIHQWGGVIPNLWRQRE